MDRMHCVRQICWSVLCVVLALSAAASERSTIDQQMIDFQEHVRHAENANALAMLHKPGFASAIDSDGDTALIVTAALGNMVVLDAILALPQDLDHKNKKGLTALWLAIAAGKADAMEKLLAAGASSETLDDSGRTPLVVAAMLGRFAEVQILLRAGADVEANDHETALGVATFFGHRDIVLALLDAGANPNIPLRGVDLVSIAAQQRFFDIARILKARGAADPWHGVPDLVGKVFGSLIMIPILTTDWRLLLPMIELVLVKPPWKLKARQALPS